MPTISVIVPVYKVEPYLRQCVDSILAQTYTDFELILIDDGSPDSCGAICDEYAEQDSRVRVIHQENGGLSAARNAGIDTARGDYLTFIDSDDWVHSMYLELLLNAVVENNVDISVCTFERPTGRKESTNCLSEHLITERITAEDLLIEHEWNYNYACGKLYNSKLFTKIRYPVGKIYEDTFTTYKLLYASNGTYIAWLNQPLYYYYTNEEGISHSPWTPKELTVFDGIVNQLEFYHNNRYVRAYKKEHSLYVNHFAYQICRILENKNDLKVNFRYLFKLRIKLMFILFRHPIIYSYRKMPQCYEATFPNIMSFYHRCGKGLKSVLSQLRRNNP